MSQRSDADIAPDIQASCQRALALLATGASARDALTVLVRAAEQQAAGGAVASILLLDEDGLLRDGASPGLPPDYLQAIDRLRPDPAVGTCAAAAATGMLVKTPDFRADAKWAELRHLPMELGFVGAWSMPIKSAGGQVLGTFGTYFRELREPDEAELVAVAQLAQTATEVIEGRRLRDRGTRAAS